MALMIKLSNTCCSWTRSPWTRGKPSANCVRTETLLFAALRTGESNNLEDSIVDLNGVLACGRLLNERADSPNNLACAIAFLDNKGERVIHLTKIRWLNA
jgi:hypothetical protein